MTPRFRTCASIGRLCPDETSVLMILGETKPELMQNVRFNVRIIYSIRSCS